MILMTLCIEHKASLAISSFCFQRSKGGLCTLLHVKALNFLFIPKRPREFLTC